MIMTIERAAIREVELLHALMALANDLDTDCGCPTMDQSVGPWHGPDCLLTIHAVAIAAARARQGGVA